MGPMDVELRVPPQTARVEIQLNGHVLSERFAPPWTLEVPFPTEPKPGRLTASAFDRDGQLLDRLSRDFNVNFGGCSPPAGASRLGATPFFIDLSPGSAELSPTEVSGWFTVGGEAVEVLDVVSGPVEVVVVQDPATQRMFDFLSIVYVRDHAGVDRFGPWRDKADQELLEAAAHALVLRTADPEINPTKASMEEALWKWRRFLDIETDGNVQFFWPSGPPIASLEDQTDVFPFVGPFQADKAGLLWHLRNAVKLQGQLRLADAVAVAGFQVASSCRRRVVLLLESVSSRDASLLEAAAVRSYLQSVQVPLLALRDLEREPPYVEKAGAQDPERWGQTFVLHPWRKEWRGTPSPLELASFHSRVEQALGRQRVVWLAGRHLPQEIEFRASRAGYAATGRARVETSQ